MTDDLIELRTAGEEETADLARRIAALARPGDAILLSGSIGAGKSVFARAFIRARLGNPAEEVPSPTFTLVQQYEDADGTEIWHFDLYRLSDSSEAWEIGLEAALGTAICLIEWPERLGPDTPSDSLHLTLESGQDAHLVRVAAGESWSGRLGVLHG